MARAQQAKDMELKEKLTPEGFHKVVKQLLQAIESKQDTTFHVKGQSCHFPIDALKMGKCEIEYEIDDGEYELQLQVKWTP